MRYVGNLEERLAALEAENEYLASIIRQMFHSLGDLETTIEESGPMLIPHIIQHDCDLGKAMARETIDQHFKGLKRSLEKQLIKDNRYHLVPEECRDGFLLWSMEDDTE